jgi:hypothetical protein
MMQQWLRGQLLNHLLQNSYTIAEEKTCVPIQFMQRARTRAGAQLIRCRAAIGSPGLMTVLFPDKSYCSFQLFNLDALDIEAMQKSLKPEQIGIKSALEGVRRIGLSHASERGERSAQLQNAGPETGRYQSVQNV